MRTIRVALCILIGCCVGHSVSFAQTSTNDNFVFAKRQNAQWNLIATTEIKRAGGTASIDKIFCFGEGRQYRFAMNGVGALDWLQIKFLGEPDADGDREEITLLGDRLWLYVDGERWEHEFVPYSPFFKNVDYPRPSEEIVLTWRGHEAVRRSDREPWVHISRIYERIIAAKKVEWRFKSRDWTDVGREMPDIRSMKKLQKKRYSVDSRGLKDAVDWCAMQVASDAAYTLPDIKR